MKTLCAIWPMETLTAEPGSPNSGGSMVTDIRAPCLCALALAMDSTIALLAALAEPTRLAATRILWDGSEHCVCELMAKLGASQSRMSRHMSVLKAAGLVTDRRDAQWVRYRRNPALSPAFNAIVEAVLTTLPETERKAA